MKKLGLADRLIVAADFKPHSHTGWFNRVMDVENQVLELARKLKGTGVCLKVNSILRACGYELIDKIHAEGLTVFADLKLFDIGETLSNDGILLREAKPEILTVVCTTGITAMQALKAELPDTEVLGVTVLTSLSDTDTQMIFNCSVEEAVMRLAQVAADAGVDGFISSPKETMMLREKFGSEMTINNPGVRPLWSLVPGDDQNRDRVMTPTKAIKAGADRIVVGRPVTQHKDPLEAVKLILDEIASALV